MFERFKSLPQVWRTGRLALRLLRDPRVPAAAKLVFGATVIYMLSPIDVVPDWFPVLGQADDLVVLLAGLNLFLRACPKWLVQEHEDALTSRRDGHQSAASGWSVREPIEGEYQRVR